jgi:hypothetical protein
MKLSVFISLLLSTWMENGYNISVDDGGSMVVLSVCICRCQSIIANHNAVKFFNIHCTIGKWSDIEYTELEQLGFNVF